MNDGRFGGGKVGRIFWLRGTSLSTILISTILIKNRFEDDGYMVTECDDVL